MQGWIKLHRKSLTSAVFQRDKLWRVWCYCLLRANHQERKILWNRQEVRLKPGQFIFGRFECSKDLKMKPSTLWKQMQLLKKMRNCDIQSNSRFSVVTVLNWDTYQNSESQKEQVKEHPREQLSDTDKNDKNEKNVFGEELCNYLKENNIDFDEGHLQARVIKGLRDYGEANLRLAINDAAQSWKKNGHDGNFVGYLFKTLERNYSKKGE